MQYFTMSSSPPMLESKTKLKPSDKYSPYFPVVTDLTNLPVPQNRMTC